MFHLQTMCDGVQRDHKGSSLSFGAPLTFNMYLELHTFYGAGMRKKEKQLIFMHHKWLLFSVEQKQWPFQENGLQGRMPKGIWMQCKTEDSKKKTQIWMERVFSFKK